MSASGKHDRKPQGTGRMTLTKTLGVVGLTATTTLLVGYPFAEHRISKGIEQAMAEQLPAAMQAAAEQHEQEKLALVVQASLKGWEGAQEQIESGRHIYGAPDADFTFLEYSDLECTFCQRFHSTPKDMVDQTAGRVNWEWKHYPLGFHNPVSSNASHAALCVSELAGNRSFWAFTQAWFDSSSMGGRGVSNIEDIAVKVGAPRAEFTSCMDSQRYENTIKAHIAEGSAAGVTGTPGTFVIDNTNGNRRFVRGAQPPQALLAALKELQEQRQAKEE